jgi:hypothetical protein
MALPRQEFFKFSPHKLINAPKGFRPLGALEKKLSLKEIRDKEPDIRGALSEAAH